MSKHTPLDLKRLRADLGPFPWELMTFSGGSFSIYDANKDMCFSDEPYDQMVGLGSDELMAIPAMLEELEMWRELGESILDFQRNPLKGLERGKWLHDQLAALLPRGDEA